LNLSIWYKLSDQTRVGLYISLIGAAITIFINFTFIPEYGYWASAFAALITYTSMMIISYIWGKIQYPIHYNIKKITVYLSLSIAISMISFYVFRYNYLIGNGLFILFIAFLVYNERTMINKILRKS